MVEQEIITGVNNWLGNYKPTDLGRKLLYKLYEKINLVNKEYKIVDELICLYNKLLEKIKNNKDLLKTEFKLEEISADVLGKKTATIKEALEKSIEFGENFLPEDIKKYFPSEIIAEINKLRLKIGLEKDLDIISNCINILRVNMQIRFNESFKKKVLNLEDEIYLLFLDFLVAEKRIKDIVYYPAGGNDFYFARKGIKQLIIHDPSVSNKIPPMVKAIREMITSEDDIIKSYNTLILKNGLFSNEKKFISLNKTLINNLSKDGYVIEWVKGANINLKDLGLVPDEILNVIEKINSTAPFIFIESEDKDINYRVWKKKTEKGEDIVKNWLGNYTPTEKGKELLEKLAEKIETLNKLYEKYKEQKVENTVINEKEGEALMSLLNFLAAEGKIKGIVYYPGGSTDTIFADVDGVKRLIIRDSESMVDSVLAAVKNILLIKKYVTKKEDVFTEEYKKFDTLIIKYGINAVVGGYTEPEQYLDLKCIYRELISKLDKNGFVIEAEIPGGFLVSPSELGLKLDEITNVLSRISQTYRLKFFNPGHNSLFFNIWKKK